MVIWFELGSLDWNLLMLIFGVVRLCVVLLFGFGMLLLVFGVVLGDGGRLLLCLVVYVFDIFL